MKYFAILLGVISMSLQNNETIFSFNLYEKLLYKNNEVNIMFSPYSLRVALAILLEGCDNLSAKQLYESCLLSKDSEQRLTEMQYSIAGINQQNDNYELKTLNALWPQSGDEFSLFQDYQDKIEQYYFSATTELNYIEETESSRQIINSYVANNTNDKIINLLPSGILTTDTRLVITNCIYFKGEWQYPFPEDRTTTSTFHINSSKTTQVQMMNIYEGEFKYFESQGVQVIDLPYKGNTLSMVVVLAEDEELVNEKNFEDWMKGLETKTIDLFLPKFKFEWSEELNQVLKNLGIQEIFTSDADLTKMSDSDLYVTHVLQKTFIDVNEKGTEAAAATAVVADLETAYITDKVTFKADHPFTFFIYHKPNQEILFFGKCVDPTHTDNNFKMHFYQDTNKAEEQKENQAAYLYIWNLLLVLALLAIQ